MCKLQIFVVFVSHIRSSSRSRSILIETVKQLATFTQHGGHAGRTGLQL